MNDSRIVGESRRPWVVLSTLCFAACYLLTVFWAKSYLHGERIQCGNYYVVTSNNGLVGLEAYDRLPNNLTALSKTQLAGKQWGFYLPYGCAIVGAAIVGIVPWTGWRFSLRSLLVAITLIALALTIYAVKK